MILRLLGLGALGFAGYRLAQRRREDKHGAAYARGQADDSHLAVRDAGPQAMRDPEPGEWQKTDEEMDQTFPASDPPANY